jgi:DNA-binding MarR family transcriptional regulator
LVWRRHDAGDRRRVLAQLTLDGEALLDKLSALHRDELQSTAPALLTSLKRVLDSMA